VGAQERQDPLGLASSGRWASTENSGSPSTASAAQPGRQHARPAFDERVDHRAVTRDHTIGRRR
jgi:hypothetical protein